MFECYYTNMIVLVKLIYFGLLTNFNCLTLLRCIDSFKLLINKNFNRLKKNFVTLKE